MLLALIASVALQAQAKELFANQSTNPSAAQFRNVRVVGTVVCGEVNKPNQQGGFNGFQRFVYKAEGDWVLDRGAGYWVSANGDFVDTEFLSKRAVRERDLERMSEFLRQADAGDDRATKMMALCH